MTTYNPFSLEGKTILVTGASSGIGQATAIECSKMGAKLVITGRNPERLQGTFEQLEGEGHQQIVADLASSEGITELVEKLPNLDGCVNNAGFNVMRLLPFLKEEDMLNMFEVNVLASIKLTNLIVKRKKMGKGGAFVFTSSISGRGICAPGNGLYSATKGAISAFMRNAAIDLAGKKIRCNSVAPGMIETPLKQANNNITSEQWEENIQLHPLKRFGRPEEVAQAIVYLLSDAASWITGTELVIDGGRSLK